MAAPSQKKSIVKGTTHKWYQFSTQSLSSPFFIDIVTLKKGWEQALWYVNGTKVVPKNISELLTPISVIIGFVMMGKNKTGFHFATNAFSYEEVKLLVSVLQDKFGLNCSIHSRNQIYVWSSFTTQLSNIVRHECEVQWLIKLISL